MAAKEQTERLEMRATKAWLLQIDSWRRKQSPIPSRSSAIRDLVTIGVKAKPSSRKEITQ